MPPNLTEFARAERTDLAEFLSGLSPQQRERPSLCVGWRVRDVVAHMLSYEELDARGVLRRVAKGVFTPKGPNAVGLAEYGSRSPEQLLDLLRANLQPRGLTAMLGGLPAFLDALIHQQDIRRPLGLPRQIPAERLRAALPASLVAPPIRGFWRARGLRLVATDVGWSARKGPEVRGNGEALLLAIAGRPGVVHELDGPGQPILAARIDG